MPQTTINYPDADVVRRTVEDLVQRRDAETLVKLVFGLMEKQCALQVRLQDLLEQRFGSSSERLNGKQLELVKLQDVLTSKPEQEADSPAPPALSQLPTPPLPPARKARKRGGRNPLPDNLPRRRVVLEPPAVDLVDRNGRPLKKIGEDVREALHWNPAYLEVIEYVSSKYADPDEEPGVVQVSAPLPLPGAIPTSALLASVIVAKYLWHLPLHRIAQQLKAAGADIGAATLGSWLRLAAPLLENFWKLLLEQTVASRVVGTDDSPVKTLDRSVARNIKRGRVWLHVGDQSVAFQYTPDWSGGPVVKTLTPHQGPIQSDGYKGVNPLFAAGAPQGRVRVGCMMHCRRGFKKALDARDERAAWPLAAIQRLYLVEAYATATGATCGAARLELRRTYSAPVMDQLRIWLEGEGKKALPRSPLGKAVTYALNQWATLVRFLEDGDLPLDNGRVERGLRPLGRGRKAWLFFGSDQGGERAVIFMTLIANCQRHGVDPQAWLTDVLTKLAEGWRGRPQDLLPAAWAKANQPAEQIQAKLAA